VYLETYNTNYSLGNNCVTQMSMQQTRNWNHNKHIMYKKKEFVVFCDSSLATSRQFFGRHDCLFIKIMFPMIIYTKYVMNFPHVSLLFLISFFETSCSSSSLSGLFLI